MRGTDLFANEVSFLRLLSFIWIAVRAVESYRTTLRFSLQLSEKKHRLAFSGNIDFVSALCAPSVVRFSTMHDLSLSLSSRAYATISFFQLSATSNFFCLEKR